MSHPCRFSPVLQRLLLFIGTCCGASSTFAQTLSVTLTPSNHNGYNISCFGGNDGAINTTVTGGTPPYEFYWTTGATTEDVADLPAGYYKVKVSDSGTEGMEVDITLDEPLLMKIGAEAHVYPNGKNISCYECFNGTIDVTVLYGVTPYSYAWDDGPTTQDRTNCGEGNYRVVVTDANGCESVDQTLYLNGPDRSDWTMSGNTGSNPATHYIGTADAQDVVFKSNGQERMRLKANGDFSLTGNSNAGSGVLYRLPNGTLKLGGWPPYPPDPPDPCHDLSAFPFWETRGNTFPDELCGDPLLGTMSNHELHVMTNGEERMTITTTGKVGIGTYPSSSSAYLLYVEGGIATRDVLVKLGNWPDYVFDEGYRLLPLSELRQFLNQNSICRACLPPQSLKNRAGPNSAMFSDACFVLWKNRHSISLNWRNA